ncbi:MAG: hypothetical protein JXR96_25545 [Deltaproteobacteria bacterium]|nr:hypothetical protein [Deltaproteobacteria bacterium]
MEDWSPERGERYITEARYGGNPEHKTRPGDYGLTPPCNPRPGKTLCDEDRDFLKSEAIALLKRGFRRGMVSVQERNGWPQNVWALSDEGEAFEAQLENQMTGTYHGYPMPEEDDFRSAVIEEWRRREP